MTKLFTILVAMLAFNTTTVFSSIIEKTPDTVPMEDGQDVDKIDIQEANNIEQATAETAVVEESAEKTDKAECSSIEAIVVNDDKGEAAEKC